MAWLKNKKTGGWFEIPDEELDTKKYMNRKIRGVGKTEGMKQADKEWKKKYNEAVQQWNKDTEEGANDPNIHYKEFAEIMNDATRKMDKTMDKVDAERDKAYNYKLKKAGSTMTQKRLATNKGVRVDGKIFKQITRGKDKGGYINENGTKWTPADMKNKIQKAKKVRYYKKWAN